MNYKDLKIPKLMNELVKRNGSDLHITADSIPFFRIQGQILPVDDETFSSEDLVSELSYLLEDKRIEKLWKNKELDLSYSLENIARFRINLFLFFPSFFAIITLIYFYCKIPSTTDSII